MAHGQRGERAEPEPRRPDEGLAAAMARFARTSGLTPTPMDGVGLYRAERPSGRMASVYEPCLVAVGAGVSRVRLGAQDLRCDAWRYLVVSVPLPLEVEIAQASRERPFLAVKVPLDLESLGDLVLELEEPFVVPPPRSPDVTISSTPFDEGMRSAVRRLVESFADPVDGSILGPLCRREILYRALRGPQGAHLRQIAAGIGPMHDLARVLRRVHDEVERPLEIDALAREAGMSAVGFHECFQRATSMSPRRYLKGVRLHRARTLLLGEGLTCSEAALRVGYASPSHFSRDFKRFFGASPSDEVSRRRGSPPRTRRRG